MRILMLTHHPAWNGADFWRAIYLGRQLKKRGHTVTLVSSPAIVGNEPPSQSDGISLLEVSGVLNSRTDRAGYNPIAVYRRLLQLRGEHFDLVHTFGHRPVVSFVARQIKRRTHSLHVADWSDLWGRGGIADERRTFGRWSIGLFDHWLERQNVRNADGTALVSRLLERRAQAWGKSSGQILRLGVGAAVDVIKPIPKQLARDALGVASNQRILVHSGRSVFDRGHVSAVSHHILDLDQGTIILSLGGDRWSGAEIAGSDFHDRVRQLGYLSQDQMRIALGACDAVLLPLRNRGFNRARLPNRVGDAAAAGRPIATNPTGDIGRLVRDKRLGIVTVEDPAGMAEAVVDLISDQEKLTQIGRHARNVAETELSWSLLAERLESFYQRL